MTYFLTLVSLNVHLYDVSDYYIFFKLRLFSVLIHIFKICHTLLRKKVVMDSLGFDQNNVMLADGASLIC